MWPVNLSDLPVRLIAVTAAVCCVFAAGFAVAWSWRASRAEAALEELRATHATEAATRAEAIRALILDKIRQAQEVESEYQAELARISVDRRPVRTIRVLCPPGPAGGSRPAGDPGQPDAATADGSGVVGSGAAGYRDLDLTGIHRLTDAGRVVSARLTALQAACITPGETDR